MYVGIQSYGGINGPGALAALYFIVLVLLGNCMIDNICMLMVDL